MKKLFTFAAMLIAAVSINAQDPISATCADAATAMPAQSGDETADVYIVTGYITNTNGTISKGQQTFYMDDVKGTKKTLQGYWCNLPAEEVEANRPLNVGDKITLKGKILNYNNTPEIKNGDVTILERATVKVDTIDATVCEALEEGSSLNDKDYSDDVFRVYGRLKGTDAVNSNGQHTFEMACGDEIFKPYNCSGAEGLELGKGDSVKVTGKLYNYGGVIEISNGKVELIEKSGQEEVIIEATVAQAVAVAKALEQGGTTDDRYAVTGYVDSIAIAYNSQYGNVSFFMTDDLSNPTYDFEAYRVKVTEEQAAKVVPGAKVKVTAALKRYYKAATEELPEIDLAETTEGGKIELIVKCLDGICIDGIWYNLDVENNTAEITYRGAAYYSYSDEYSGVVTIPASVTYNGESYSVTSIGGEAFENCKSLTSVTIGNSVTSIGNGAFWSCSGLTSVTIPNSVTSIGGYAFCGCSSLTSVTIPNSVTSIGYWAFSGCSSLTSITIPNSVTSIEGSAFESCTSLTSIYVPCGELERFRQMLSYDGRVKYEPLPYNLTINAENGSVTYPKTNCDDMQLTATPDYGYHFAQWNDGNTSNPRTFELTRDTTFTAQFAPNQYTLSLQCDNNQGTVEGAGVFDYLAQVQISATPAYGYHFSSWSDGNTDNPRTYTVTKDVTLTVNFAPNTYTLNVSCNAEQGSVTGSGSYNYLSNRAIEAIPNYGYHFAQWNDGNTDNPRTFELRQDTAFVAIFAVDKYGTCGDNLQLTWRYDTGSQTLTISGDGDLTTNMRYGVEAVKEMKELVIEEGVGVIGNEAFANIKTLNTITLGKDVRKLQERVFYNCYNLTAIYNYRKTPASATSNTFEEVDKYACTIYVMAGSEEMFRSATGWKDFYSILTIGASETTVTDNNATVVPSANTATVTWPVSNDAFSYTIEITKDGVVFCRLTFNANGQLTGIAFAPGRDGQSMAPAAVMTANGLQFTVTGLDSNTKYGYSLTAKDANEQPIATYSGSFTTTSEGVVTGISNTAVEQKITKILRNAQLFILRGDKTYTIQGQEVR